MAKQHKHEWYDAERIFVDGAEVMRQRCACGEKHERAMTAAEKTDFKTWRDEMGRLDREGEAAIGGTPDEA